MSGSDCIKGVEQRMDNLEGTVKESLSELTKAVKTLIVIETEHRVDRERMTHHSTMIKELDTRMDKEELVSARATRFMDKYDRISTILVTGLLVAALGASLGFAYG